MTLGEESPLGGEGGEFVAQFFFALGGLVGVEGDLSVGQGRLGKAQASAEVVALNFVAVKFQFCGIQLEAARFQFIQKNIRLGAAGNVGVGDAAAPIGEAFLIEVFDVGEGRDALAHIGGEGLEVAQGFELGLEGFDIQQILVKQIIVDEGADVGERAEGKSLDDLGGKGVFELAEAVEQVDTIIFEAGEDAGAGVGRQGKVFEMTFESACVEELAWGFEKPVVVERGVVDDEISHIRIAPVLVRVNHRAMREECAIGIFEFERDHARRVAAQITLGFGAEFAAHVTGESPLAAAERCLVESHVTLSAHEGKLHCVEDGGFSCSIDADEVGGSLAVDGGVFKEVPVDEADVGEEFHEGVPELCWRMKCVACCVFRLGWWSSRR